MSAEMITDGLINSLILADRKGMAQMAPTCRGIGPNFCTLRT